MNNETTSIHFDTIDRACEILDCEPGDLIIRKKVLKRNKVIQNEQNSKAI